MIDCSGTCLKQTQKWRCRKSGPCHNAKKPLISYSLSGFAAEPIEVKPIPLYRECQRLIGNFSVVLMKTLLVTGSSGLIGSEVCVLFRAGTGWQIHGVDNNQRAVFFGPQGDTRWNQHGCNKDCPALSTTNWTSATGPACWPCSKKFALLPSSTPPPSPATICAASRPFDDFDANAVGTLEYAGGRAANLPRIALRPHEHQQGLWRCAQHESA